MRDSSYTGGMKGAKSSYPEMNSGSSTKPKLTFKQKFVNWLTGYNIVELIETKKRIDKQQEVQKEVESSELYVEYLFDFKNWASEYSNTGTFLPVSSIPENEKPQKIKIKPIDALIELETIPTPFSLTLIDDKIKMLKEKASLINQHYAKREVEALIQRLENRKKYNSYKDFFERFSNTTDEKISPLLTKYDLVMRASDIFIPEFPDEAIIKMKEYSEKLMEICNAKPVFYVIATEESFKKSYEKRDPILLVQSPFGFYWQILGAWDKEMLLLSEL